MKTTSQGNICEKLARILATDERDKVPEFIRILSQQDMADHGYLREM